MIPDPAVWAKYEIKILQHVMPESKLLSFDEMRHTFQLPTKMYFHYPQLRHAIQA